MEYKYQEPFPLGEDTTDYYLLTKEHVSTTLFEEKEILCVKAEGLTLLAKTAFRDVAFLLRTEHQQQVAAILTDPEASKNDKFVALTFLRNAEVSTKGQLPFCQDTGTAIIMGKKGQQVWTDGNDEEALSNGVYMTYTEENLRYSQNVPLTMYDEKNTGCNLPAQIDLYATQGDEYKFLCIAKGGGSANKTYLFQETKALLNPDTLVPFLVEKMKTLGTAACPPYHIAFVIGGTSAEANLKTVKLASAHYYDSLPTAGNIGGQAFRDIALEKKVLEESYHIGLGAQFGGKYFAHDIRIIRLPRHGASCPVGMGVSCSADRNIKAKINKDGIWIEKLENNPGRFIPEELRHAGEGDAVRIDLNQPMPEILNVLDKYPVGTRLSLNGTIIVGRDIAHARLKACIDKGEGLPQYIRDHPIYYAGPAKTPKGMPSGSFGPTTAGRMDSYVDLFQSQGGSMVMIAKGNRSRQVTDACRKHGGFYLGSIGGPAAILALESIKKVDCLEYPELGMEAIWKIEVENFPAFMLVDNKGNDFFNNNFFRMKSLKVPFVPELDGLALCDVAARMETDALRQYVKVINWSKYSYKPVVVFDIARGEKEIYLHYFVRGLSLRAMASKDGELVHPDSCVEFFMRPSNDLFYTNFEFNCIGVCLAGRGHGRNGRNSFTSSEYEKIRRYSTVPKEAFAEKKGIHAWELTVAIPFELMGLDASNLPEKIRGNFYKCADETANPHYVTWSPIPLPSPDYHCPEYFGEIYL